LEGLEDDDQKSGAGDPMSAYSDHSTVGGQVLAHRFRMRIWNYFCRNMKTY
jgi:hypothetical protein